MKNIDHVILPKGGKNAGFNIDELRKYMNSIGNILVVGNSHLTLSKHKKTVSLDVWCRNHSSVNQSKKDTCQALRSVVKNIISFDDFALQVKKCPTTKKMVYSIVLINNI